MMFYHGILDPAPASSTVDVDQLASILVDDKETLWHRYRAMFALRNINSPEAIKALAKGKPFTSQSASLA